MLFRSHPIHGSTTGTNLRVNQQENIWYCFRDGSGGGVFEAWAVARGLIDCSNAKTGWFGSIGNEKKHEILSKLEEEFPERIKQFDDLNLSLAFASRNKRPKKIPAGDDDEGGLPADDKVRKSICDSLEGCLRYESATERWMKFHDASHLWEEVQDKKEFEMLEEVMADFISKISAKYGGDPRDLKQWGNRLKSNNWTTSMSNMLKTYLEHEFGKYPDDAILVAANGVILHDGSLREFSKDDYITADMKIPTDYHPELAEKDPPSIIERFLHDLSSNPDNPKGDPRWTESLLDILGYCLQIGNPEHKIIWWIGTGGNGKSVLHSWLEATFGKKICALISAKEFQMKRGSGRQDTLAPAISTSRIMVVGEDTGTGHTMMDDGIIKSITGNETVTLRVIYKREKSYPVVGTPIFISNKAPSFTDGGNSMKRRVIVTKFEFDPSTVDIDPYLPQKLAKKENTEWLLATLLKRLIKYTGSSQKLQLCERIQESTSETLQQADDVQEFLDECIESVDRTDPPTKRDDVFAAYIHWRDGPLVNAAATIKEPNYGAPKRSELQEFVKKLQEYGLQYHERYSYRGKDCRKVFLGIKIIFTNRYSRRRIDDDEF